MMVIAGAMGLLTGLVTGLGWWVLQYLLANAGLHAWFENRWFLVPILMGWIVALFLRTRKKPVEFPDAIPDLVEEFHFGIQRSSSALWAVRSLVSGLGAFFTGIFGMEGAVIEGVTATMQAAVSRFPRGFTRVFLHDIEFRQVLVDGVLAGTFSVVLGAPFSGAIFSLEVLMVSAGRVRIAAFTSALAAFGVWRLLSQGLSIEHFGVVPSLYMGFKSLNVEGTQLLAISVASLAVGALVGLVLPAFGWTLAWLRQQPLKLKWSAQRAVVAGSLLFALTALLTPQAFMEPWRIWQEMTWGHLSWSVAAVYFLARMVALLFALAVLGSAGVVTPVLFLGALAGYAAGGLISASWALPLALSGAAAALFAGFGAPMAACAIILEVSNDGTLWWLSILAVGGAFLAQKGLRLEPFIGMLLERRGIRLVQGRCAGVLKDLQMKDAMASDVSLITEATTLGEMQKAASDSSYNVLGVCGDEGEFRGLLSLDQLPNNADLKGISPKDLLDQDAVVVKPSDSLEDAFQLLASVPALAVVGDDKKLQGLVFKTHMLVLYQREIGRRALSYYTSRARS